MNQGGTIPQQEVIRKPLHLFFFPPQPGWNLSLKIPNSQILWEVRFGCPDYTAGHEKKRSQHRSHKNPCTFRESKAIVPLSQDLPG